MKREDFTNLEEKLEARCNCKNTFLNYRRALWLFYYWATSPFYGNCDGELTQENIERFIDYRRYEGGKKPRTLNVTACALKKAAAIRGNDVKVTNVPKVEQQFPEILTEEEVNIVIENIRDKRDKAVWALLYDCALRLSELRNLNMDDVDFEKRRIHIRRKGNVPQVLPFTEKTALILKEYLHERRERGYSDKHPPFFIGTQPRISVNNVERIIKEYARRLLGKTGITPHSLRHSRATALRERGVGLEKIKDFLGHSNIQTTFIYARMTPKELETLSLEW